VTIFAPPIYVPKSYARIRREQAKRPPAIGAGAFKPDKFDPPAIGHFMVLMIDAPILLAA
jgi:hypothetical protein